MGQNDPKIVYFDNIFLAHILKFGARIASLVQRLATLFTVRRSNPGGGEIFHTRPDRLLRPPILQNNGCLFSLPGVKRPGRGADHSPPSSVEVKRKSRVVPLLLL
jgi:hypothetical protein